MSVCEECPIDGAACSFHPQDSDAEICEDCVCKKCSFGNPLCKKGEG